MNAEFLGPKGPGYAYREWLPLDDMDAGKVLADVMEPHGLVTADKRKIGRKTSLTWMPLCYVATWRSICLQIAPIMSYILA